MAKKPKFKPVITRVKLNPEQAVLVCNCYNVGNNWDSLSSGNFKSGACDITFIFGSFKPTNTGYTSAGASSS